VEPVMLDAMTPLAAAGKVGVLRAVGLFADAWRCAKWAFTP